ncbi:MAG TPA: hypothetical protein VL173_05980 [Vicinamibacterales bacterium]|jgi:hypothetical protein|nr:hypothetical protein [Vicinamibacterales bacterium]
MTDTQFIALSAAIAAAFAWMIAMRRRRRSTRVLGVCIVMGIWIAFRRVS